MGCKLVLFTNEKSHTSSEMPSKLISLNGVIR